MSNDIFTNLWIEYERDASLRAYEVIYIDPRADVGARVVVPDKWLRDNELSLGINGVIALTLMAVFAALWTNTVELAGLLHASVVQKLGVGVDIT